jgi:hypothetical protein
MSLSQLSFLLYSLGSTKKVVMKDRPVFRKDGWFNKLGSPLRQMATEVGNTH